MARFVDEHPELQELVRQWAQHPQPVSEDGLRPLFPFVEKLLRLVLQNEGEKIKQGETLIPLLQLCCSDRLRFFNLLGYCCDDRHMERISVMRAALVHGDYSRDITELREGKWNGTESDYQKILPQRLVTIYYALNSIVQQVDPETGKFRRSWKPGRALCESCNTSKASRI